MPASKRGGVRARTPTRSKTSNGKTSAKPKLNLKPVRQTNPSTQPSPCEQSDDATTDTDDDSKWFPKYTLVEKHPLWMHGNAYVYRNPVLSADKLEERRQWALKLQVPETLDDAELVRQGRLKLNRGEAVFCQVTEDPTEDVFKVANTPANLISDDMDKALKAMTATVIGDPDQCGPNVPSSAEEYEGRGKGPLEGGTAYERRPERHVRSAQGVRCYQNTITCEQGANLIGPAANLKGPMDDDLVKQADLNKVRPARILGSILTDPNAHSNFRLSGSCMGTPSGCAFPRTSMTCSTSDTRPTIVRRTVRSTTCTIPAFRATSRPLHPLDAAPTSLFTSEWPEDLIPTTMMIPSSPPS